MNKRIIHTGLYTERANKFLERAFEAIKNRAHNRKLSHNIEAAKLVVNPDGEVVIEADLDYYNTIWNKNIGNDKKPKEWLAVNIKLIVRNCFRSDGAWNRLNDDAQHYVDALKWYENNDYGKRQDFTVAEAYLVYDILLNRKNVTNKYPEELFSRIVGKQKDPLKTEMERVRREKLKAAEAKYEAEKNRIYNEQQEKIRKVREQFQAEADIECEKAKAVYDAEVAEIERKVNSVNRVGSLFAGIAA